MCVLKEQRETQLMWNVNVTYFCYFYKGSLFMSFLQNLISNWKYILAFLINRLYLPFKLYFNVQNYSFHQIIELKILILLMKVVEYHVDATLYTNRVPLSYIGVKPFFLLVYMAVKLYWRAMWHLTTSVNKKSTCDPINWQKG